MSHIVEFTVSGLAGRKNDYGQKLNRGVNIFFGLNGSGKTSLLKILDSAMYADVDILKNVPFKAAEVSIYSIHYDRTFVRRIEQPGKRGTSRKKLEAMDSDDVAISEMGRDVNKLERYDKHDKDFAWTTQPLKPKDAATTKWRHIYLPTWRLYVRDEPHIYSTFSETGGPSRRKYDWDIFFGRRLEHLWSSYSNELLSKVQTIQGKGIASILRRILATKTPRKRSKHLDPEMAYQRVAKFLARQGPKSALGTRDAFEKRYKKKTDLKELVNEIDSIEEQIEEAMASREKLRELIQDMFTGGKTVIFKDTAIEVKTEGEQNIELASLSSGEKHVLWILIETMLVEQNALLIDEPEISLHVDWQKGLVSAMRQLNPDAQLILATHSPEITADASDKEIFQL